MNADLSGRVALVTGAGSGIGAASARALADAGAAVAVTDVNLATATEVAKDIEAAGGAAEAVLLDVADENHWSEALHAVHARFGPVTVLHSNAADISTFAQDTELINLQTAVWDRVFAVAARGSMLAAKHTLPDMLAAGQGSIVYTSSIKGRSGSTAHVAYSSAKGSIESLARMIAANYGPAGIRCNAVAPGVVDTPAARANVPEEFRQAIIAGQLLGRLAEPEDIAQAVVFLASDAAAMITGQVLVVDGGMSAHIPVLCKREGGQ